MFDSQSNCFMACGFIMTDDPGLCFHPYHTAEFDLVIPMLWPYYKCASHALCNRPSQTLMSLWLRMILLSCMGHLLLHCGWGFKSSSNPYADCWAGLCRWRRWRRRAYVCVWPFWSRLPRWPAASCWICVPSSATSTRRWRLVSCPNSELIALQGLIVLNCRSIFAMTLIVSAAASGWQIKTRQKMVV